MDIRPPDRRQLVDPYVTIVIESREPSVSAAEANAHQRSIQQRAGNRRNSHRVRGNQGVILNDLPDATSNIDGYRSFSPFPNGFGVSSWSSPLLSPLPTLKRHDDPQGRVDAAYLVEAEVSNAFA